jgi:hypothetical protein
MPGYRLYLLDTYSGHINGVEEIHSADDLGAIALATERPRDVPAELWCGSRKICRFDALPEIAKYADAPGAAPPRLTRPRKRSPNPLLRVRSASQQLI